VDTTLFVLDMAVSRAEGVVDVDFFFVSMVIL